jgi:D-glycero-D-manno-heptose 1,7-bisphosphate phosphatase
MVSVCPPRRAVFLDRDGVLNRPVFRGGRSYPPENLADFALLEGVVEACDQLKRAGFLLIVVTNQPDVASGKQARAVVEAMHERLQSWLPLDEIRACYHRDADACTCRKPLPGMILAAAEQHHITLSTSYLVGDRWRDIGAGQAAGCTCYFIDYQYAEPQPSAPFHPVTSLLQAANHLLSHSPCTPSLSGCAP